MNNKGYGLSDYEKVFLSSIIYNEIIYYKDWLKKNKKLKGYSIYLNFESNLKILEDLQNRFIQKGGYYD